MSFDIKFTRQGFENACLHREACRDIENSFDIKFTRQGFDMARLAKQFKSVLKAEPGKLEIKKREPGILLSVYLLFHSSN